METYVFSSAIHILGAQGANLGAAVDLERDVAKRFISKVKDGLKRLEKLRTGRKLMAEINGSGHLCRIFCAPENNEGAANADPQTIESNVKRMIKTFRPQYLNMLPASKQMGERGKQVLGTIKAELKEKNMHQSKIQASTELDFILVRAWGDVNVGRKSLTLLLGKSRQDVDAMCDGLVRIEDDDYFRICFAYYKFLKPGPGCNTQVKLKAGVKLTSKGTYKPKTNVAAVAPEIIIGHELIHAWRMMKGMRIVDHGWEEEAMTTGCGPFSNFPITENALRREGGYPIRPHYQPTAMSTTFGTELLF